MQPWERDILEYRPNVGINPKILSTVTTQDTMTPTTTGPGIDQGYIYTPSDVAARAASMLGTDVIDNLMASLSRANDMLNKIQKCIGNSPVYKAYTGATNPISAREVWATNLRDINGITQLDVVPLLQNLKNEMQTHLDFLNNELFDGSVDYNNTDSTRQQETDQVNAVLQRESEGRSIDYSKLTTRVQVIACANQKAMMFKHALDRADTYLTNKAKDYVQGDIEGALQFITSQPASSIPAMQDALNIRFKKQSAQALQLETNTQRMADRDVREMMDAQMSSIRSKMASTWDALAPMRSDENIAPMGGEYLKQMLYDGMNQVYNSFSGIGVEHLSTSITNINQHERFFTALNEKKKSQVFNDLMNKIQQGFDYNDKDREIQRFMQDNGLQTPGTYCG